MNNDGPVAFLLDVDNTLLDNDRIERDIKRYLDGAFGPNSGDDFWKIFEEVRAELGYADYFGALQRYQLGRLRDPRILDVSSFLIDYKFRRLPISARPRRHRTASDVSVQRSSSVTAMRYFSRARCGVRGSGKPSTAAC